MYKQNESPYVRPSFLAMFFGDVLGGLEATVDKESVEQPTGKVDERQNQMKIKGNQIRKVHVSYHKKG
ncbi:hypothetical protein HZA97_10095 [Candidatus Woesearchaeota archaeon]|nr:hypothetical protein [Candidatus Woesearchaeota archaeon]